MARLLPIELKNNEGNNRQRALRHQLKSSSPLGTVLVNAKVFKKNDYKWFTLKTL